jgi:hypothetical protein
VLVLDAVGLTASRFALRRFRKTVRWENVEQARVSEERWAFGTGHDLVLVVRQDETSTDRGWPLRDPPEADTLVTVPLDRLSLGWEDIVGLVEERLGRRLVRTTASGLIQRG